MGAGHLEPCTQPALPHPPEGVKAPCATFTIGKEVWIEREDFEEVPPKGYKRLFPGNKVRLKGGYVIECTGCTKDADGKITEVLATVVPDTKSGTPGSRQRQGQSRHHLGGRGRRRQRRSAHVRPPVSGRPARRGRQRLPGKPEPQQPESGHRHRRAVTGQRRRTRSSSLSGMGTLWRIGLTTWRDQAGV
jgi:glutamyl/glutaminyl-tRNA synthetase